MMNLFKKLAGFALMLTIAAQAEAQMRYYSYYNIANDGNQNRTGLCHDQRLACHHYILLSGRHRQVGNIPLQHRLPV